MKPAQEMKGRQDLETTGSNPALLPDAVATAAGARHPTLNTKPLFKLMVEKKASDLFFTSNAPIKIKIEGQILPVRPTTAPADGDAGDLDNVPELGLSEDVFAGADAVPAGSEAEDGVGGAESTAAGADEPSGSGPSA